MNLKLEFPNISHKNNYEKLINEWSKVEDLKEISPWALFIWDSFDDFLRLTRLYVKNSPRWVNSTLFFLINNEEIIWWIQIRHSLWNKILIEKWWHIWYWIAPKYRKKWYATKMLELWLIESKKLWLEKILITCDIDNIGSKKIIEKNWWVFERFTIDGKINRYWIDLK